MGNKKVLPNILKEGHEYNVFYQRLFFITSRTNAIEILVHLGFYVTNNGNIVA